MNPSAPAAPPNTPPKKSRVLSARRAILLATTIAGLGAAALVIAPGLNLSAGYPAALAQNLTEQAHKLQAPIGFADIVEKVKAGGDLGARQGRRRIADHRCRQ